MKKFNLDSFNEPTQVTLEGKTYHVRGLTVEELMNGDLKDSFRKVQTDEEYLSAALNMLEVVTDIPQEKLNGLGIMAIAKLVEISNGVKPEENGPTAK